MNPVGWGRASNSYSISLLVIILHTLRQGSTGFEVLHQEGSLFYPELGIHVESTGFTYAYSDFIHLPIVYHLPIDVDVDQMIPKSCDLSQQRNLATSIENAVDQTKRDLMTKFAPYRSSIVPTFYSTETETRPHHLYQYNDSLPSGKGLVLHRSKRVVGMIALAAAAVAVVGLVGANTYEIARIRHSAVRLEREISGLHLKTAELVDSANILTDRLNNIGGVVIPQIQEEIRNITQTLGCQADIEALRSEIFHHLALTVFRVSDIVNALLQHTIIPELLTPQIMADHILTRPDMTNSLYGDDAQLVYQLSQAVLTSIHYDPFVIGAVMIIPRIMKEHIGMTLSVTRVPLQVEGENRYTILNTPELVLKDTDKRTVWSTDYTRCRSVSGIYFCSLQVLHRRASRCLQNIVFNESTEGCSRIPSSDDPYERLTLSGLLLTNRHIDIKQITKDKDGNTKSALFPIQNSSSVFIHKAQASEILVGNRVYALMDSVINVEDEIPRITIDIPMYNMSAIPTPWENLTNLEPYSPTNFDYDQLHTISWVLVGLNLGCVLLLIMRMKKLIWRVRNLEVWVQGDRIDRV